MSCYEIIFYYYCDNDVVSYNSRTIGYKPFGSVTAVAVAYGLTVFWFKVITMVRVITVCVRMHMCV